MANDSPRGENTPKGGALVRVKRSELVSLARKPLEISGDVLLSIVENPMLRVKFGRHLKKAGLEQEAIVRMDDEVRDISDWDQQLTDLNGGWNSLAAGLSALTLAAAAGVAFTGTLPVLVLAGLAVGGTGLLVSSSAHAKICSLKRKNNRNICNLQSQISLLKADDAVATLPSPTDPDRPPSKE